MDLGVHLQRQLTECHTSENLTHCEISQMAGVIMRKFGMLFAALVAAVVSGAANAAVFDFTYTNGSDTFGSGQFFTSDTSSPFTIINVTGTETYLGVSGIITGISNYAGADNLLYFPGSPTLVDFGGISFTASVPVSITTPSGTDAFGIGFTNTGVYGITQQSSIQAANVAA